MAVELLTLGSVSVRGETVSADTSVLAQPKRLGVLGYLVLAGRKGWVPRQDLLGMFWPDHPESRARKALSQTLWVLRNELGEDLLQKRGSTDVALEPTAATVDVWAFLGALDRGDDAAAVELYRGEFLPGLVVTGAPAFERWLEEQRSVLRNAARNAAWRLAEEATEAGRHDEAARWARAGFERASRHDEQALRRLMRTLVSAGDRAAAASFYEAYCRELASDGEAPQPATQTLAVELLGRPALAESGHHPRPSARMAEPTPSPDEASGGTEGVPSTESRTGREPPGSLVVAATVALVLLASALAWLRATRTAPLPAEGGRVAVLPFDVEGNDDLAYLRTALVDLLSARLDGAGDLRSIDPATVLDLAGRTGEGRTQAVQHLGADVTVAGTVVALGTAVEIRATLQNRRGRTLGEAHVKASREEDLSAALDTLTLELVSGRLSEGSAGLAYGASQETRSLPALKAYLRGEEAFRKLEFEAAIDAFQEAVAYDSAFALAHFRLSRIGDWLEDGPLVSHLDVAQRFKDHLPRRQHRLLDAYTTFWRKSLPAGTRMLEDLVANYPDYAEAWFQLGDAQFHGGPRIGRNILASEPAFRRALALTPADPRAALHLLALAAYQGNEEEARHFGTLVPPSDAIRTFQVTVLSRPRDMDDAEMAEALNQVPLSGVTSAILSPANILERPELFRMAGMRLEREGGSPRLHDQGITYQAIAAVAEGRPIEAAAIARRLVQVDPPEGTRLLGYLATLPWRTAQAWTSPRAAADLTDPDDVMRECLLAIRSGNEARTDSLLPKLSVAAAVPRSLHRISDALMGAERALAQGEPERGISVLDAARRRLASMDQYPTNPVLPLAEERFLRARLLEAAGRDEEALEWYNTMVAAVSYDVPFAAHGYAGMARLLRKLGRVAEADEAARRARRFFANAEPEAREALEAEIAGTATVTGG